MARYVHWSRTFTQRPPIVTWGLGLAAIYSCFGIFAGLAGLFSMGAIPTPAGSIVLSFPATGETGYFGPREGFLLIVWNLICLIAVYRAQWPRQIARFTVIGFTGVLGIAGFAFLLGQSDIVELIGTVIFISLLLLPVAFLMSRSAEDFYDR